MSAGTQDRLLGKKITLARAYARLGKPETWEAEMANYEQAYNARPPAKSTRTIGESIAGVLEKLVPRKKKRRLTPVYAHSGKAKRPRRTRVKQLAKKKKQSRKVGSRRKMRLSR